MPAIIRFLGYNPLPPGTTWAERLLSCRTAMGSRKGNPHVGSALNQGTVARWERGEQEPTSQFAVRAERFLTAAQSECTALTA